MLIQDRFCKRCGHDTTQQISTQVKADDSLAFGWWCFTHKWWTERKGGSGFWISRDELIAHGINPDDCPVVENRAQPRCAKCGRRGAQEHHWAPKHLFPDANEWPTDYLCPDCHKQWHDVVTPSMGGPHGLA